MKKLLLFVLTFALLLFSLTSARAEEGSEVLTSGDYTYVVLEDGTAEIRKYMGSDQSLTIPDTLDGHPVTCIGDRAFMDCRNLQEITLPGSVTTLRDKAFSNCLALTRIVLPDSVAAIGANPFSGDGSLTEIVVSPDHPALAVVDGVLFSKADHRLICYPKALAAAAYSVPEGTTAIGDLAFYACSALEDVALPEGILSIGDGAFYSCGGLKSIALPDSVVDVGPNPFRYCDNLTEIVVSPDHPALAVVDGVLFSKADHRLICYPKALEATEYTVPEGTTSIGDYGFARCGNLTSITLPDSVTVLGNSAFYFCDGLTDILLPDGVKAISDEAFLGCRSLTNLTLPKGVTSIGAYAFSRCAALTDIVLPDGVASIGGNAFSGCDALTLTVSRDSFAAQYCQDNGLPCAYSNTED